MLRLTRWCIAHRRLVLIAWVRDRDRRRPSPPQAAGRNYASNFTLPGTESQRALDLLAREFPPQSGDVDTFVFHVSNGTIDSPAVRGAMIPAIAKLAHVPARRRRDQPVRRRGAVEVSRDRRTAFATINYSKRANLLPNDTGKPVLDARVKSIHVAGLKVAAGGQVIEQAEGFNIGPGDDRRRDRRARDPADHLRLAARRGDAAHHGRARPDHRRRADRPRHPRARASRTSRPTSR